MLQPITNRLFKKPPGSTCGQRKALEQRETVETVASALRGRDVALPHHPRPTVPRAQTPRRQRRQDPGWEVWLLPQQGRTTLFKNEVRVSEFGMKMGPTLRLITDLDSTLPPNLYFRGFSKLLWNLHTEYNWVPRPAIIKVSIWVQKSPYESKVWFHNPKSEIRRHASLETTL